MRLAHADHRGELFGWPYSYTTIHYLKGTPKGAPFAAYTSLPWLAVLSFPLLTIASYISFVKKRERG